MIPLPYKLLGLVLAAVAIMAAVLAYGHRQYTKGYQIATTDANTKIDRLKLDASTVLAKETKRANDAEHALQDSVNKQELQDANHQKTVSSLADQLRRAAGVAVRLRDPNAAPGCRLGSGSAPSQNSTAASVGADNGAEAGGLLSRELTEFLLAQAADADKMNLAFKSCRAYALEVSKPPPE